LKKYISKKESNILLANKTKHVINTQDFALAIMSFLARLNDGHTYLDLSCEVFGSNSFMFKFRFYNDGYYLIKSSKKLSNYLGSKLIAINNHGINDIEKSFSTIIPKENETSLKYYLPSKLMEPIILDFLNLKDDKSIKLQLENNGKQIYVEVKPEDSEEKMVSIFKNISNMADSLTVKDTYWFKEIVSLNSFYFQFNKCIEKENLTITEVVDTFEKSNLINLIIDLRNNKGGDSDILNPLIRFLKKHKNKYKVIVLTGADTYSSAIINLLDLSTPLVRAHCMPFPEPVFYSYLLPLSILSLHYEEPLNDQIN